MKSNQQRISNFVTYLTLPTSSISKSSNKSTSKRPRVHKNRTAVKPKQKRISNFFTTKYTYLPLNVLRVHLEQRKLPTDGEAEDLTARLARDDRLTQDLYTSLSCGQILPTDATYHRAVTYYLDEDTAMLVGTCQDLGLDYHGNNVELAQQIVDVRCEDVLVDPVFGPSLLDERYQDLYTDSEAETSDDSSDDGSSTLDAEAMIRNDNDKISGHPLVIAPFQGTGRDPASVIGNRVIAYSKESYALDLVYAGQDGTTDEVSIVVDDSDLQRQRHGSVVHVDEVLAKALAQLDEIPDNEDLSGIMANAKGLVVEDVVLGRRQAVLQDYAVVGLRLEGMERMGFVSAKDRERGYEVEGGDGFGSVRFV